MASDVLVLKVDKVSISDLHGGPVCVDSFFDVFLNVDVQNSGLARTTLTWNGPDYRSDFVSGTHAFHVQTPSVASDNPACSDTKTVITSIQNNQGVIGFQLVGSMLGFDLALSPEATAALLPPTSDIHEALDRLCDYIAGQNPQRTIGVLTITNQSDVFAPNSPILNGDHAVFIRCSDDHMIFDEVQGEFHLDLSPYLSDNCKIPMCFNVIVGGRENGARRT